MTAFSGASRRSIHIDAEFGKSVGLPAPIGQRMMLAYYVSELATPFFGDGWRRDGKMSVRFVSPVFAGDVVYVSAVVKQQVPEGDATRVVLDVWCEEQSGRRVTAGTPSGLVR